MDNFRGLKGIIRTLVIGVVVYLAAMWAINVLVVHAISALVGV